MGAKIVEITGFQDLLVQQYRTKLEDASTLVARFDNGAHGIVAVGPPEPARVFLRPRPQLGQVSFKPGETRRLNT